MDKYQTIDSIINLLNDAAKQLVAGQPIAWGSMTAGAIQQLVALRDLLHAEEEKCEK